MEVGANDIRSNDPESTYHNWPMANVRMAAELKAKGYHYQYLYCLNAGHGVRDARPQPLPEALEWVWKHYQAR